MDGKRGLGGGARGLPESEASWAWWVRTDPPLAWRYCPGVYISRRLVAAILLLGMLGVCRQPPVYSVDVLRGVATNPCIEEFDGTVDHCPVRSGVIYRIRLNRVAPVDVDRARGGAEYGDERNDWALR